MKKIFKLFFYSLIVFHFSFTPALAKPFRKFISIESLKLQKQAPEIFELTGYVVQKYQCPVCPPDKECKPCMKDNIIISNENKSLKLQALSNKELIIFTKKIDDFQLGEKYIFVLRSNDQHSAGEALNDLELVSFKITK